MRYQRDEEYYQYDYSDRRFHKKWRIIAFKNNMHDIEFLPDYKIVRLRFQATKHVEISFLKHEVKNLKIFLSFFLEQIHVEILPRIFAREATKDRRKLLFVTEN